MEIENQRNQLNVRDLSGGDQFKYVASSIASGAFTLSSVAMGMFSGYVAIGTSEVIYNQFNLAQSELTACLNRFDFTKDYWPGTEEAYTKHTSTCQFAVRENYGYGESLFRKESLQKYGIAMGCLLASVACNKISRSLDSYAVSLLTPKKVS